MTDEHDGSYPQILKGAFLQLERVRSRAHYADCCWRQARDEALRLKRDRDSLRQQVTELEREIEALTGLPCLTASQETSCA